VDNYFWLGLLPGSKMAGKMCELCCEVAERRVVEGSGGVIVDT